MSGDDFVSRSMGDTDPALLDFVKTKIDSFVKWDLLRFLHENPHTANNVANIAKYAGRNVTTVIPELEDLVEGGVVQKQVLAETPIYSLATDETTRALVDQFILACEDGHFRVKVVHHILQKTR